MLRALTLALTLTTSFAVAQSDELPNATTHGALIDERQREADVIGEDLKSRLQLLQREFDLPDDLTQRALDSLENGRVREMLNIGPDDLPNAVPQEQRYPGGIYLFASFSMPDPSLEAILRDAADLGIPVVFNGFVENSVIETEKRVRAVYEGSDISQGFIIDPTLFTRFNVVAVPTLISTMVNLDVCATTGCDDDGMPEHDRVAGNVPLRTLMTIIARGDTDNSPPVKAILGELE